MKEYYEAILNNYVETNPRTWTHQPIVMPLLRGNGPATEKECDEIVWEVWDLSCEVCGEHKYLLDAINQAMVLTKEEIRKAREYIHSQ